MAPPAVAPAPAGALVRQRSAATAAALPALPPPPAAPLMHASCAEGGSEDAGAAGASPQASASASAAPTGAPAAPGGECPVLESRVLPGVLAPAGRAVVRAQGEEQRVLSFGAPPAPEARGLLLLRPRSPLASPPAPAGRAPGGGPGVPADPTEPLPPPPQLRPLRVPSASGVQPVQHVAPAAAHDSAGAPTALVAAGVVASAAAVATAAMSPAARRDGGSPVAPLAALAAVEQGDASPLEQLPAVEQAGAQAAMPQRPWWQRAVPAAAQRDEHAWQQDRSPSPPAQVQWWQQSPAEQQVDAAESSERQAAADLAVADGEPVPWQWRGAQATLAAGAAAIAGRKWTQDSAEESAGAAAPSPGAGPTSTEEVVASSPIPGADAPLGPGDSAGSAAGSVVGEDAFECERRAQQERWWREQEELLRQQGLLGGAGCQGEDAAPAAATEQLQSPAPSAAQQQQGCVPQPQPWQQDVQGEGGGVQQAAPRAQPQVPEAQWSAGGSEPVAQLPSPAAGEKPGLQRLRSVPLEALQTSPEGTTPEAPPQPEARPAQPGSSEGSAPQAGARWLWWRRSQSHSEGAAAAAAAGALPESDEVQSGPRADARAGSAADPQASAHQGSGAGEPPAASPRVVRMAGLSGLSLRVNSSRSGGPADAAIPQPGAAGNGDLAAAVPGDASAPSVSPYQPRALLQRLWAAGPAAASSVDPADAPSADAARDTRAGALGGVPVGSPAAPLSKAGADAAPPQHSPVLARWPFAAVTPGSSERSPPPGPVAGGAGAPAAVAPAAASPPHPAALPRAASPGAPAPHSLPGVSSGAARGGRVASLVQRLNQANAEAATPPRVHARQ